jgi:hypothetical protein
VTTTLTPAERHAFAAIAANNPLSPVCVGRAVYISRSLRRRVATSQFVADLQSRGALVGLVLAAIGALILSLVTL